MTVIGDGAELSRRAVLQASGGAFALPIVGTADWGLGTSERCPEATFEPSMVHCEGAHMEDCLDDHPETEKIQAEVDEVLEDRYPTVGSLIDDGFVPYFDIIYSDDGWSHWINPEYVGDDTVLDPERPESVLVDEKWWRPIGVMFIATRDGEPMEEPPAVYQDDDEDLRCSPWHSHVGLPGRYAWWKYRKVFENPRKEERLGLPCRTPCMMHVWTYPHPETVYAHDAPPRENRGGPPAEPAGFETDATPGEDKLSLEVLPDYLKDRYR